MATYKGKRNMARYLDAFLSMLKSKFITQRPFFLAHAITYGCNSRCSTCTYWHMSNRTKDDMSTQEVFNLLDEAYDQGIRGYYLFGGEPLIRKDVGKVIDYAKNKGFVTTMNTNASLLAAKACELHNLDFIFASLDYFNDYHDFIRRRKGSFNEVIAGIKRLREVTDAKVTLVTTISTLNLDAIEPMAKLAHSLRAGISYNAVEPTVKSSFEEGRTETPVHDYGLGNQQLKTFYESLLRLKLQGYPLMETRHVLKHFTQNKPWICQFPKMFVYVSADKKIFSCTCDHTYDLHKGTFQQYFRSKLYKNHVTKSEKCNICIRTCVRGYSYTYDLKPLHLINLINDGKILFTQKRTPHALLEKSSTRMRH